MGGIAFDPWPLGFTDRLTDHIAGSFVFDEEKEEKRNFSTENPLLLRPKWSS